MAFARLFFPTEAKLAMDIGHAATTPEFAGLAASKGSDGNLRGADLDETPIMQNIRLRSRMEALTKTGTWKLWILLFQEPASGHVIMCYHYEGPRIF